MSSSCQELERGVEADQCVEMGESAAIGKSQPAEVNRGDVRSVTSRL